MPRIKAFTPRKTFADEHIAGGLYAIGESKTPHEYVVVAAYFFSRSPRDAQCIQFLFCFFFFLSSSLLITSDPHPWNINDAHLATNICWISIFQCTPYRRMVSIYNCVFLFWVCRALFSFSILNSLYRSPAPHRNEHTRIHLLRFHSTACLHHCRRFVC